MLKQVVLLKRRPGMTIQEFKDYYENNHSKFGEKLMPMARRYVRRYVNPERNPLTNEVVELDFDVVMEIWWDSREDFEATMKKVGESEWHKIIMEDEKNLFSNHDHRTFTVEEFDTVLPRSVVKEKGWVG